MSYRSLLILIIFIIGVNFCLAQTQSRNPYDRAFTFKLPEGKHFFVVPPDSLWSNMPWKDSIYLFPEFQKAKLESKNGYSHSHPLLMNYNIFFEMLMLKQENGTLIPFQPVKDIKYIWIGDHKFIYSKSYGYLHIILDGRVAVAESTFMDSVLEYNSAQEWVSLNDNRFQLSEVKRYYYVENRYYIVETSSGRIHRVTPNVLPNIFSKEKETIRDFEKQNKIDYNKKDDLMKIVLFCNREL